MLEGGAVLIHVDIAYKHSKEDVHRHRILNIRTTHKVYHRRREENYVNLDEEDIRVNFPQRVEHIYKKICTLFRLVYEFNNKRMH